MMSSDDTDMTALHEIATLDMGSNTAKSPEDKMSTEIEKLPKLEVPKQDGMYVMVASDFKDFFNYVRSLKIELVFFLYMFSYVVRSVTAITMIMEKVCHVHLEYSAQVCNNLELKEYEAEKKNVEAMTNNYHLFHTLVSLTPSAVLASFIGPWSDTYGRKVPIIVGLIGIIIDGTLAVFCAYKIDSRVEWYVAIAAFTGFSGGFVSVFTVLYSYVSDTTAGVKRTFKYALAELAMGLGSPLGSLAGGWLYRYTGYVPVFLTSVSGHLLGLFFVIYYIAETRGLDNKDSWQVKIRNFLSLERLKEGFRATTKTRPNKGHLQIWFLILSTSLVLLAMAGGAGISFLYTFHHYNWDNTKYSTVGAIFSIIGLFASLAVVPICTKVLKLGDPTIGIFGSISNLLKNFCIAFSNKEGGYYFAQLFGLFIGLANLAGRSRISKIVPKEDLGKVFAFLSTIELVLPIVATSIVIQVYNKTIGAYPDPSYLSLGFIMIAPVAVFIWMACLPKVDYEKMVDEEQERKPQEDTSAKTTEI